jgi:hypothetical protein
MKVENCPSQQKTANILAQEHSTAGAFDAHTTAPAAPHFRPSH